MLKHNFSAVIFGFAALVASTSAVTAETTVPDPFQGFSPDSRYSINYAELNQVLKKVVIDTGWSSREKAEPTRAKTGTRMKANVKRSTVKEGNRFMYEVFDSDEVATQYLLDLQKILEGIPSEAPLEYFSREEQLAYWLNLYNLTLINEIIKVYPERSLKKLLTGKKSILGKKLLNVAGIPLSLNDIQYVILKQNYHNNPLVLYGLYQGIIGGPNIRKNAYTAANVMNNLEQNAAEFINSNRGTYAKDEKVFRVSSLYDRNRGYFPDFQKDLKAHLLGYIKGSERRELQDSTTLKPDISDWTVTDLYGSYPELGGSLADNSAALLDSVTTLTSDQDGNAVAGASYGNVDRVSSKSSPVSYVSPELIEYLQEVKMNRDIYNQEHGTVTVEELGEVQDAPATETGSDGEEND